jgi:sugar lactone lactonase YvrE
MSKSTPQILLDGLRFPECPRWHEGKLWFSDMYSGRVATLDEQRRYEVVAEFDDRPAGLGFLPDGTPIVVIMDRQHIVRLNGSKPRVHADLTTYGGAFLNDMIVDGRGRAYVNLVMTHSPTAATDTIVTARDHLVTVDVDGQSSITGPPLVSPNGLALSGDGKTMLVNETLAHRVTSLSVASDGMLSNPQIFASFNGGHPDGLCIDVENAAWVATATANKFVRVARSGHVLQTIDVGDKLAVACTLGGRDRRTLFMLTTLIDGSIEQMLASRRTKNAFIEASRVDVAGAGYP